MMWHQLQKAEKGYVEATILYDFGKAGRDILSRHNQNLSAQFRKWVYIDKFKTAIVDAKGEHPEIHYKLTEAQYKLFLTKSHGQLVPIPS